MYIQRRDKENNLFYQLHESSLKMVQQLSGEIWTDYNVHDPGITILDHLHYALYELQYTLSFPFTDYLNSPAHHDISDYASLGLFPKEKLFAPSVVTPSDYERLFRERVEEIEVCRVTLNTDQTYTIRIKAFPVDNEEALKEKVKHLYHAHRNLCETLGEVLILPALDESEDDNTESNADIPVYDVREIKKMFPEGFTLRYSSIQNDFPDNYGINRKGKPTRITTEHESRILQLKGYLLIFDYLMAYNYQQVDEVASLLSFSENIPSGMISDIDINDVELLVDNERKNTVSLRDSERLHKQKALYLDMLDSLYGEDTAQLVSGPLPEANRKRIRLIRNLTELNGDRFRSFNILDQGAESLPVIQRIINAILDYDPAENISLYEMLSRFKLRLISDAEFFLKYDPLFISRTDFPIKEDEMEEVPIKTQFYDERRFRHYSRQLHLLWHQELFQSYLHYGNQPDYYRIIRNESQNGYLLVYKHPGMDKWLNMGFFFEKDTLIQVTNDLWGFMTRINNRDNPFYLVEHILLANDEPQPGDMADNHTLSVIIPLWNTRYSQYDGFESLLQERLPAHLRIRCYWLDTVQMYRFEVLYKEWRRVLAVRKQEKIIEQSNALRSFISTLTPMKSA